MDTGSLTAAQRSARAKMGGFARLARHDIVPMATAGQAALVAKFREQVLAHAAERDEELTEDEIARRTEARRRQHFVSLAYKSSRARQRRKAAPPGTIAAET